MSTPTQILILSGNPNLHRLGRLVERARSRGQRTLAIAELREELPRVDGVDETAVLDDFRDASLTIRNSAEETESLLHGLRPLFGDRFSQMGGSLWLADETNLLCLRLLRAIDCAKVVARVFDEIEPVGVTICGPPSNLGRAVLEVARRRRVSVSFSVAGPRQLARQLRWRLERALGAFPALYLLVGFVLTSLRDRLRTRAGPSASGSAIPAESDSSDVEVTFLATNPKQSDIVVELFRHLECVEGFRARVVNIYALGMRGYFELRGIESRDLGEWGGADVRARVRRARARFWRDARAVVAAPEFATALARPECDVWPLAAPYLLRFTVSGAPALCEIAERFRAYLDQNRCDLVVTPAEWSSQSRACVIAASAVGTRSLSLQRGDITAYPGWGEPIFSDRFSVNGPAVKDALVSQRVPSNQVIVNGDPRLDRWLADGFFESGQTRRKLGISEDCKLVAVMTNPVTLNEKASHAEEYVSELLELAARDSALHFVIKLHPNEYDLDFYERIRERAGARNATIIKDLDTPQLLHDSDCVVTTISTTGEEAIFLGRPLVVVNLTNEPSFMPYVDHDAALTVRERGQLEGALHAALYDPDVQVRLRAGRADYIARHFLSDDGRARERCAETMRELVRGA